MYGTVLFQSFYGGLLIQFYYIKQSFYLQNPYFKRYIDDLFFLWEGTASEAAKFTVFFNQNPWGIKFTHNFSDIEIQFLDLSISHNNDNFITSTYFKSVDTNSYLDFSSGHYSKWKKNVPYGQFRRVRKNCSEDATFEIQAKIIAKRFLEKGYPIKLLEDAYTRAKSLNQNECLTSKEKEQEKSDTFSNRTKFITTYNRSHVTIQKKKKILVYFTKRPPSKTESA